MALVDDKSKKVVMVTDEESTIVDVSKQDALSVRKIMKDYWDRWVGDPTESGTSLELMVGERNYKQAKELHESDMMEVLGLLPNLKGMDVLELGGGSGRLSGELAKKAKSVVATDFVEAFVKENEETNGPKYPNMTFRTLDAAKLDYPPNTFDLIFSNWLLMYLSDTETTKYAYNNLMMLKPGGFTFFRESHFRPVGSRPQAVNPTVYRNMKEYRDFFSKARYTDENNVTYFFEFIYAGNCQTYIHRKGNPTQVYYLWRKTKVNESPSAIDIQQLLDKTLYNEEDMKVYNKVIGNGFVTPGGLDCSKELIVKLNLKADSLILDVGCGLGGLEAYLVKECDIDVTGLELSLLASQAAVLRMNSLEAKKGHMHIADVAHTNFASNMFDAIFARETLEYIGNKETILKKTHRWLKSNGQLLMGDYCLGKEIIGGDTTALIQSEGLNIITVDSYIKLLEESGYINVQSEDHSQQYISYLTEDLTKLETAEGIEDNTKKKFSTLWQSLVASLTNKDLAWMVFVAKKQ